MLSDRRVAMRGDLSWIPAHTPPRYVDSYAPGIMRYWIAPAANIRHEAMNLSPATSGLVPVMQRHRSTRRRSPQWSKSEA